MADISKIQLPDGTTLNFKDATSGYITSYTDENMKWTASTSSNTYYPLQSTSTATTGTANTLNSVSFYQFYNTTGGYRRLILGNGTAYTSTGGAYGAIRLYGAPATYYGDLIPGVLSTSSAGRLTANRTWTFPDASGTVALTSNIPTKTSDLTNDSGFVTSDTKNTAGASNSTSTLYLVGATSQDNYSQTYTNSFLSYNNGLYSESSLNGAGQVGTYISQDGSTGSVSIGSYGGSVSGNITIGSTGTSITGLVAPTNNTDAATKKYVDDSIPTVPSITLNGSSTTSPSFYAPTTAGTSGYVLKSNGSGAPTWAAESGGGSTVTVTQTLTSGTEIASISVNNVPTKIYAPPDTLSAIAPERIDNTSDITNVTVSGVTVSVSPVVLRSGYVCTLDCEYTLTAALSSETTVATGLPPRIAGGIIDVMQQSTSYARPLRVIVNANGDLKLRYGAAGTYWIHMSYISSVPNSLIADADNTSY